MTSVAQLPVEAPATQALPKGEMPRGRSRKSTEEGGEGGFSAVLAEVLPERRQAAKAERAVELKGSIVEGEDTPAGSAEGEAATAAATELLAVAVQVEEASIQSLAEPGDELVTETKAMESRPVAAASADGVVEAAIQEAEIVEGEGAPRQKLEHPPDAPLESPEVETRRAGPQVGLHQEEQRHEPRPVERARPERLELRSAEAVSIAKVAAPEKTPVQTVQPPHGESTSPQKAEAPPIPKELTPVEQRRINETPPDSKKEPPRPDAPPIIEFQVRKQSPAQELRQEPQTPAGMQAPQGTASEAQPKAAQQSKPAEIPPQQALSAQAVTDAKPAEKAVPVVAVVGRESEPVRAEDATRASLRPVESNDASRLPVQAVAAAPESQDGAPVRRVGTGDAAETRDVSVGRQAQPKPQAVGGRNVIANLGAEPKADTEQAKQVAVKPLSVAPPVAPPASAEQAAPLSTIPPQASLARPAEEARPVVPARPPSEPAIAAKLQQEGGRTTLNVVLQDERLGRVALQLVERGGWIETAIRASDPRTAQTLTNGAAGLFEALQHRGLNVSTGNGAPAWDAQEGQRRDNPQRDQESQKRRFRLRRSGGEFESALARTEV